MNKYGDNAAFDWPDQWCNADDGVQDVPTPGVGDDAYLTGNSNNATLTADTAVMDSLTMTNYMGLLDLDTYDLKVSGDVILGDNSAIIDGVANDSEIWCGGSLTVLANTVVDTDIDYLFNGAAGTKTLTTNGVALGNIEIDDGANALTLQLADALNAGDVTLTDGILDFNDQDVTIDSFTMTGGTLVAGASNDIDVGGNIIISGGTFTRETATWTMSGDGDLNIDTKMPALLVVASGVTTTVAGNSSVRSLDISDATLAVGVRTMTLAALASDALTVDATSEFTGTGLFILSHLNTAGVLTQKAIEPAAFAAALELRIQLMDDTRAFQMTGNLNIGGGMLSVQSATADEWGTLDMNGHNLTCGALELGIGGASARSGRVLCGEGIISVASVTMGHDDNSANVWDFETCCMILTGIFKGNNDETNPMTVTSAGANLVGGTIQKTTCTGILRLWGVTEGAGNTGDLVHHGGVEIGNPFSNSGLGGIAA